jgi:hypothetical protein
MVRLSNKLSKPAICEFACNIGRAYATVSGRSRLSCQIGCQDGIRIAPRLTGTSSLTDHIEVAQL